MQREAGVFGRESSFRFRKPELVPEKVKELGGVLAVIDHKRRIESNLIGIAAQQPSTDCMEGAGPTQCFRDAGGALPDHRANDPLDSPNHLVGGPSREVSKGSAVDPPRLRPDAQPRCASVLVLPEPAPAITRRGPLCLAPASPTPCSTARRCSGFSRLRCARDIGCEMWARAGTQPEFMFLFATALFSYAPAACGNLRLRGPPVSMTMFWPVPASESGPQLLAQ
jgi:hypothetical protein